MGAGISQGDLIVVHAGNKVDLIVAVTGGRLDVACEVWMGEIAHYWSCSEAIVPGQFVVWNWIIVCYLK